MGEPKGKKLKARVLFHVYQGSLFHEQDFLLVKFNNFEELRAAIKRVASLSDEDTACLGEKKESVQEIPSPSSLEDVLLFYGEKYGPRTNVRVMQVLLVD